METIGQKESFEGEMPERQSTAFASKACSTSGFQAPKKYRETVANDRMAEGRNLDSNRLREAQGNRAKSYEPYRIELFARTSLTTPEKTHRAARSCTDWTLDVRMECRHQWDRRRLA